MLIETQGSGYRVAAPAKLNLFLEVLGKREDGYHEIESLMCPISLCDILEFRSTDEPEIRLEVVLPTDSINCDSLASGNDPAWDVPADETNLVYRAAQCVRDALGVTRGCVIKLTKVIPSAAGLGGGSSDAAATVVAAMLAWNEWDRSRAAKICETLGSDLNVFLGDENRIGLSLAQGRGEKCRVLEATPELEFVVTHPPAGCSTRAVYANWLKSSQNRSSEPLVSALQSGQIERIGSLLFNALTLSARQVTPWIDNQLRFFLACQFQYNAMTGSGSSCFALASHNYKMAEVRRAAQAAGLSRVYAVKSWFQPSIEEQIRLIRSS